MRPSRGFLIFVEARPGVSGLRPGSVTFASNPADPHVLPDLQILVDRPLGNGSTVVCDRGPGQPIGGIPATVPLSFADAQAVSDAINDFACRFDARAASAQACTRDTFGVDAFTNAASTIQFCTSPGVGSEMAFPPGDTIVTVRVRDIAGQPGPPRTIVVRVRE